MTIAILLFFLSLVLVVAEIFIPSMGVISVGAAVSLGLAIWLAFKESPEWGYGMVGAAFVAIPIVIVIGLRVLPHTGLGRLLILDAPDRSAQARGRDVSTAPRTDLIGLQGQAVTALRPSGVAEIGSRRVDVVSDGPWVDAGVPVKVVSVEGNRVVVRATESAPVADSPESSA